MNNLRIECQQCRTLWKVISADPKLKGRLTINPFTSTCYLCEKEWGLPPLIPHLWYYHPTKKQWEPVKKELES